MESELASLREEAARLRASDAERAEVARVAERDLVQKCESLEQQSVQVKEMEKMLLAKNVELAESLAKAQVRKVDFLAVLTEVAPNRSDILLAEPRKGNSVRIFSSASERASDAY